MPKGAISKKSENAKNFISMIFTKSSIFFTLLRYVANIKHTR